MLRQTAEQVRATADTCLEDAGTCGRAVGCREAHARENVATSRVEVSHTAGHLRLRSMDGGSAAAAVGVAALALQRKAGNAAAFAISRSGGSPRELG